MLPILCAAIGIATANRIHCDFRALRATGGDEVLRCKTYGSEFVSPFTTTIGHTIRAKIITYSILKTINPVRFCVSDG